MKPPPSPPSLGTFCRLIGSCVLGLAIDCTSALPVYNDDYDDFIDEPAEEDVNNGSGHLKPATLVAIGLSIAASLGLVFVVFACLCWKFKPKGTCRNGVSVPFCEIPQSNSTPSTEFTIFPPAAGRSLLGDTSGGNDDVRFEPLPDIRPRRPTSDSGVQKPRPATFRNVVMNGLSCHDWFENPYSSFPRKQLQYVRELGSGWFGQVVEGEAYGIVSTEKMTKVVVKILMEGANNADQMHFLNEVKPFRDSSHPNVLKLLGKCLESDPFLVILEDCALRDLKSYLIKQRSVAESLLKENCLLSMACNVASGLRHLHEMGFVLTDLAARNCLVTNDCVVKIGDYGNSIEMFKDDYYCAGGIAVPVRWCAPETLRCTPTIMETREVTREANVWSFGVVLWELIEFGKLPYIELNDDEFVQKVIIEQSERLKKPLMPCAHLDRLFQIIQLSQLSPKCRPNMERICAMLSHLLEYPISSESLDGEFESRWNALQPRRSLSKSEFELHKEDVDLNTSRDILSPSPERSLSCDSDFQVQVTSASLQNLRGSPDGVGSYTEGFTTVELHAAGAAADDASECSNRDNDNLSSTHTSSATCFNEAQCPTATTASDRSSEKEVSPFTREVEEVIRQLDEDLDRECPTSDNVDNDDLDTRNDCSLLSDDHGPTSEAEMDSLVAIISANTISCGGGDSENRFEVEAGGYRVNEEDEEDTSWKNIVESSKQESHEITRIIREKSQSAQDFLKLTVIDSESGSDSDGAAQGSMPNEVCCDLDEKSQVCIKTTVDNITPLVSVVCSGDTVAAINSTEGGGLTCTNSTEALSDLTKSLHETVFEDSDVTDCSTTASISAEYDMPTHTFITVVELFASDLLSDVINGALREAALALAAQSLPRGDADTEPACYDLDTVRSLAQPAPCADCHASNLLPVLASSPSNPLPESFVPLITVHEAQDVTSEDDSSDFEGPVIVTHPVKSNLNFRFNFKSLNYGYDDDLVEQRNEPSSTNELDIHEQTTLLDGTQFLDYTPVSGQDEHRRLLTSTPLSPEPTIPINPLDDEQSMLVFYDDVESECLDAVSSKAPTTGFDEHRTVLDFGDLSLACVGLNSVDDVNNVPGKSDERNAELNGEICHFNQSTVQDTASSCASSNVDDGDADLNGDASQFKVQNQVAFLGHVSRCDEENNVVSVGQETVCHEDGLQRSREPSAHECRLPLASTRSQHLDSGFCTEVKESLKQVSASCEDETKGCNNCELISVSDALCTNGGFNDTFIVEANDQQVVYNELDDFIIRSNCNTRDGDSDEGFDADASNLDETVTPMLHSSEEEDEEILLVDLETNQAVLVDNLRPRSRLSFAWMTSEDELQNEEQLQDFVQRDSFHGSEGVNDVHSSSNDGVTASPDADMNRNDNGVTGENNVSSSGSATQSSDSACSPDNDGGSDCSSCSQSTEDEFRFVSGSSRPTDIVEEEPGELDEDSVELRKSSPRSRRQNHAMAIKLFEDEVNLPSVDNAVLLRRASSRSRHEKLARFEVHKIPEDTLELLAQVSTPTELFPEPQYGEVHESIAEVHESDNDVHVSDAEVRDLDAEVHESDTEGHESDAEGHEADAEAHGLNAEVHELDAEVHELDIHVHDLDADRSFGSDAVPPSSDCSGQSLEVLTAVAVMPDAEVRKVENQKLCREPLVSLDVHVDLKDKDAGATSPAWGSGSESSLSSSSCLSPSLSSSTSGEFDCTKPIECNIFVEERSQPECDDVWQSGEGQVADAEMDEDDDNDDDDDEDDDDDKEPQPFQISVWNKDLAPIKSLLRSPNRRLSPEERKAVSFKLLRRSVIYEYPREVVEEPVDSVEDDDGRALWNFHVYNPELDYSTYADWELANEEMPEEFDDGSESSSEFASPAHHSTYPYSNMPAQQIYKLSNIGDDLQNSPSSYGSDYYGHPDSFDFATYLSHYNGGEPYMNATTGSDVQQPDDDFWLETILNTGDFFVNGSDGPFEFTVDSLDPNSMPQWALSPATMNMYAADMQSEEPDEMQQDASGQHQYSEVDYDKDSTTEEEDEDNGGLDVNESTSVGTNVLQPCSQPRADQNHTRLIDFESPSEIETEIEDRSSDGPTSDEDTHRTVPPTNTRNASDLISRTVTEDNNVPAIDNNVADDHNENSEQKQEVIVADEKTSNGNVKVSNVNGVVACAAAAAPGASDLEWSPSNGGSPVINGNSIKQLENGAIVVLQ